MPTSGRKTVTKPGKSLAPLRLNSRAANHLHPSLSRRVLWRDIGLTLVMVSGLSMVFLSPFLSANRSMTTAPDRILGAATAASLTVPVTVRSGDQVRRLISRPQYGTIAEALGQAAAGSSFEYTSRGSSIYLRRFLNLSNDVTGGWQVRVNGVLVADLSLRSLEQGDQIAVERQSP
ncbi:MAG: hypothetical protein AAB402_03230 [Patescibacteria group bacterium]